MFNLSEKSITVFCIITLILIFGCKKDEDKPVLVESNPKHMEQSVATDQSIRIAFNKEIEVASEFAVILNKIYSDKIERIKGDLLITEDNRTLIFKPKNNFEYSSLYRLNISEEIVDKLGNKIDEKSVDFSTETGVIESVKIAPASGLFTEAQEVSLVCSTSGVAIRYTLDGTNPTSTTGILYVEKIRVDKSLKIKAAAFKEAWNTSAISEKDYIITENVEVPESVFFTVEKGSSFEAVIAAEFDLIKEMNIYIDFEDRLIETDDSKVILSDKVKKDVTAISISSFGERKKVAINIKFLSAMSFKGEEIGKIVLIGKGIAGITTVNLSSDILYLDENGKEIRTVENIDSEKVVFN